MGALGGRMTAPGLRGHARRPPAERTCEPEYPRSKGCWYFTTVWACVLCGYSTTNRERQWTPRPERAEDRAEYIEGACGSHFA